MSDKPIFTNSQMALDVGATNGFVQWPSKDVIKIIDKLRPERNGWYELRRIPGYPVGYIINFVRELTEEEKEEVV